MRYGRDLQVGSLTKIASESTKRALLTLISIISCINIFIRPAKASQSVSAESIMKTLPGTVRIYDHEE